MKKLIYEVIILAVVISITSNSVATFAAPPKGSQNNNSFSINSSANEYVYDGTSAISSDQLEKLLEERLKNPEKYKNASPKFLTLQKNELSQSITQAIEEGKRNPIEFDVRPATSVSSNNYGTIKDKATGVTISISKTPRAELEKYSPKNLAKTLAAQNEDVIEGEFREVGRRGARFNHFKEFMGAARHAGVGFPTEALSFYTGVMANHMFNLVTSYEKNPMALEMFMEELQSVEGQIGFFAFMVGNRYAGALFQSILAKRGSPLMKKLAGPFMGFLAMGVGSLFSNIAHDLITMTKPCAKAMYNPQKEEFNTNEKRLAVCQEGWNAVMTSDNLARYVTSVMTVVIAAIGSSVVQKIYKGIAGKVLPLDRIQLVFRGLMSRKALAAGKKVPGPIGVGIRTLDLVIFLQADEHAHPYLHYLVETTMNSSFKLGVARTSSNMLVSKLYQNKWEDVVAKTCSDAAKHASQNTRDHVPAWIQNEIRVCSEGQSSSAILAEKNMKWRETLSYEFMNSYMNWIRFISEFQVMHDVSREYFQALIAFAYSAQQDMTSFEYNPLTVDSPFYGIYVSKNVQIVNENNYREVDQARAQRIVEALPLIDQGIAAVNKHLTAWNAQNTKDKKAPVKSAYLQNLIEIKKSIETYKSQPTPANYPHLLNAVKKIIANYNSSQEKSSFGTGYPIGPYASYATEDQKKAFNYVFHEEGLFKKSSLEIRNFLGEPKPLMKGQAFLEIFNESVKESKSEYLKLFDKKKNPAETITWYAVCGNQLQNGRVDVRRAPLVNWLDKYLNYLVLNHNLNTKWVTEKLQMNNIFKLPMNPVRKIAELFNYGTGIDFYIPKIVTHSDKELKNICNETTYAAIGPGSKSKVTVAGKSYDSLLSYLINNIRPEVLNVGKDDFGFESPNFDGWWDSTITPKVGLVYQEFMRGYDVLLQGKYRKAVDAELARGSSNQSFNRLDEIFKGDRALRGNAKSLIQSYYDEANNYLKLLNTIYVQAPERMELLKTAQGKVKYEADNKIIQDRITNIRYGIYSMLNDFRNFDTKVSFIQGKQMSFKTAMDETSNINNKYALVLIELSNLYGALGFSNQVIQAAALKTPFFIKKDAKKDPMSLMTPMQQIALRIQNDISINEPFAEYYEKIKMTTEPQILTYGLNDKNAKIVNEEIQLGSNFTGNDRLTLALNTSNQLFMMSEDLFKSVSILNAAKIDNTYETLDRGQMPKGQGSRPF